MLIETPRLILRSWRDNDKAPFAALNADPEVMRFFERTRSREESDNLVDRLRAYEARDGFCFAATERKEDGAFIGMVGIVTVDYVDVPFAPTVEVGWRLAKAYWRQGYASEAAAAALDWGFATFGIREIVAFTAELNMPSRAVMARVGMTRDLTGDFEHPDLPVGHALRPHVLFRKRAPGTLSLK